MPPRAERDGSMSAVDLSIVVAVRNQRPHNELFLETLRACSRVPSKLIVVDNSSSDGSGELFKRAGACVIATGGNLCYPESMNRGLAEATGEYIGFLNNDIVVSPGWDMALIDALERHRLPVVSPVGIERMPTPHLTRVLQERWRAVKRWFQPVRARDDLRAAVQMMYGTWEVFCERIRTQFADRLVPGIVGSCVVMRRSLMLALGGWDPRVLAADWDLYLRLNGHVRTPGELAPPMIAAWVYAHHYVQATRLAERATFTCTHPTLGVEEKWGGAAIAHSFFDPSLLSPRPRLHRAPLAYLRNRARRLVIEGSRAVALARIAVFGLPSPQALLAEVASEAALS